MPRVQALIVAAAMVLTAGCLSSTQQLESAYVPYDSARPVQVWPRLKGESCEWRLFGVIGVGGDNSLNAAVAKMTRGSTKIDNLLGVHIEKRDEFYLVVGRSCTLISGYPVVYKDTGARFQLFERNMMDGKLGEKKPAVGRPAKPTPAGGTTGGGTTYQPTVKTSPVKHVEAPPKASAPTKGQCDKKCARFATLWKGSDAIRSTIRGQCIKKCLKPENVNYRDCIDGASKLDDIARCNGM
jgi:hypothetical protein